MADLGNLKILLDMATTATLKSILKDTDEKLDNMRKKASSLQLGFDEKSITSLSTKMRDIAGSMQEVSKSAGTKLAEGLKQSAEASKAATTQIQQQVTLSTDLEALFKEMAGMIRTIAESQGKVTAATKASTAATKEATQEQQKRYDITRLRQKAEEKNGQLERDEIAVLKQMEAIEKALVALDEKHSTHLADQLKKWMHYDGVTKEQLGTYQALITRMQAAMQAEQKTARQQEQTARKQKQAAKDREAAIRKQAQLETTLIRIDTQLLGLDQSRLQAQTKLLLAKKQAGTITQEEAARLSALLSQERAIAAAEEKKAAAAANTTKHFGRQAGILSQINSYLATYVSVIGAVNLIRNLVRITGEFEAQHVALRAILQDVAGADRIFYQLQELAVKSPFTFRNLTDYAKQLSAFSVPMNEIYETTKRLADVSAGLGVDMGRIILAYGQIRSASFLRGQEVRQLTEAGIPVLQELSKQFKEIEGEAVSVGKVFDKISARQVPFEMIERMFKNLTSEGGKFYQMQEVLAATVKGKVSNLQDAWEIMLSKIGESNEGFIKGAIDGVTKLIKNYKELGKVLELAAVAYGTYRVACVAATQAQAMQGLVMAATGTKISTFSAILTKLAVSVRKIPGAIAGIVSKFNIWAVAITAVTTATAYLIMRYREMNKHLREADKITGEAIARAEASKSNIHYYIEEMKRAKEGTEEYNRARQAVIDNSGNYISATDAERLSLQNVDDVWVNICNHIEEATKLQAFQSATATASASKQEAQLKVMDELATYQQSNGLSNEMRQNIAAYIRREITRDELERRIAGKVREASGGYYSPGSRSDILYNADRWWDNFEAADRRYYESINRVRQNLNDLTGDFENNESKAEEVLDGWRKRVSDYLQTVQGGTRGVKVTGDTNLADFAEGGAKALNELRKALELIPEGESDYKKVKADIKFWTKLSEAIYGKGNTEFNNSTKLTKQQLKDAEALRKEQIQAIKQSVQDLKEAKKWYDQLAPLLGSENAKTLLASFNFAVPKEGFGAAFQGYADQLKALGDENGARDVMNWANGREVGDVLDSAKAIEKYTEALRDLEAQTKRLNLSGFAQELDKIIVDADSKNRQLETNWAQKAEELEKEKEGWVQRYQIEHPTEDAEKAWDEYYKSLKDKAEEFIKTQKEYNNKVVQESINKKADEWVKTMLEESNIDMTDWSDKTVEQIEEIQRRLKALMEGGITIPPELMEDANALGVTFEQLLEKVKKLLQLKIDDTDIELDKARVKQAKEVAKTANSAASAVKSFADAVKNASEATRDKALFEFADALSVVADATGEVTSGFSKMFELYDKESKKNKGEGNWFSKLFGSGEDAGKMAGIVGMLITFTVWINKKMLELGAEEEEFSRRQAAAVRNARNVARMQGANTSSIFGNDDLSQTLSDMQKLDKIRASMEKYQAKVDEATGTTKTYSIWQKMLGWMYPENWTGHNVFAGSLLPDNVSSIADLISNLGLQMYDEYGNLNAESLQQILDTYETLTDDERAWIEQAIQDSNDYAEVMGQLASYLESVFGQVGDSIADSMISAFEETGQAAFDTGEILSDVARNFIKDWTKAFLMKNYLNNLSTTIEGVWQQENLSMEDKIDQSLGLMRDVLASMSDDLPYIQQFYEALDDQFHWADGAGEEIGDAIKTAMVEQNSSLIAGYINSIRADLTMQRNEIMRNISPAVMTISNGITEHFRTVASIDGNVSRIWARLDLLTSSGSGVKINTRI